jgi:hypothetical protein
MGWKDAPREPHAKFDVGKLVGALSGQVLAEDDQGRLVIRLPDIPGVDTRAFAEQLATPGADGATHPQIAVAEGSQANYPLRERESAPDFSECLSLPSNAVAPLALAANFRDRLGDDVRVIPNPIFLNERVTKSEIRALTLPIIWGVGGQTRFRGGLFGWPEKTLEGGPDGPGPPAPALQPLWFDPLNTIFGSPAWKQAHASG